MALKYPIFDEPYGRMIIACGELQSDDADLLKILAELNTGEEKISHVVNGEHSEFIAIFGGFSKKPRPKHLHVEAAIPKYFKEVPKENTPWEQLNDDIKHFYGQRVETQVKGRFEIPLDEVESRGLIRLTNFEIKMGDFAIKQTFTEFSIEGGYGEKIDLSVSKSPEKIRVQLAFQISETIDDEYLKRLHDASYKLFESFVIGKGADIVS